MKRAVSGAYSGGGQMGMLSPPPRFVGANASLPPRLSTRKSKKEKTGGKDKIGRKKEKKNINVSFLP